jgi:hypothetical protein
VAFAKLDINKLFRSKQRFFWTNSDHWPRRESEVSWKAQEAGAAAAANHAMDCKAFEFVSQARTLPAKNSINAERQ